MRAETGNYCIFLALERLFLIVIINVYKKMLDKIIVNCDSGYIGQVAVGKTFKEYLHYPYSH